MTAPIDSSLENLARLARPPRIAVDLTPMLPGGANGGAKIFVLELLRQFNRIAPDWRFTLLTPEVCHEELAALDSPRMKRICALPRPEDGAPPLASRLRGLARGLASRIPPEAARVLIDLYWRFARRPDRSRFLQEQTAHLLFCPFTAPFHHVPGVPTVCVIYDLQFLSYPQFFDAEERYGRAANFRDACEKASRLICISDYVRSSVLRESGLDPAKVITIPIQLANRLRSAVEPAPRIDRLAKHGLEGERYLLYPANFWPHKNHRMLLTAFAQYLAQHSESDLRLVCTGQPGPEMDAIVSCASLMGIEDHCRFPGFVPQQEFTILLENCRAVVFPSLYEGFGMPVLEAMEHGKPVACSNRTSLPEVAGNAAVLFDPRVPAEIAAAIDRIESDEQFRQRSSRLGLDRRALYGEPEEMARRYLSVFTAVLRTPQG